MGVSKDKKFPNFRLGFFFLKESQKIRYARNLRDEKKLWLRFFRSANLNVKVFFDEKNHGEVNKKISFSMFKSGVTEKNRKSKKRQLFIFSHHRFLLFFDRFPPCICIKSLISFFQNYLWQSEIGLELIGANQRPFFKNEIKNMKLHFLWAKAPKKILFFLTLRFSICLWCPPFVFEWRSHVKTPLVGPIVFRSNFDWHK